MVVVLTTFSPDASAGDLLAHVLHPHTALVVRPAQDDLPPQPGVVYPSPGGHLLVTAQHRMLSIEAGQSPPARPCADLLLTCC